MDESKEKLTDQEQVRQEKLASLKAKGIELYPYKFAKTHFLDEIVALYGLKSREELENEKIRVKVAGRIMTIRRMGRATFFHIANSQAKLQAYLREDVVGLESYRLFDLFDIGDLIGLEGTLFRTKTGELTVLIEKFELLAKCFHPLPEKWHGLQDVETRYRRRYLDLIMNPEVAKIFVLRSRMISLIRKFFDDRGYLEVETPMMQPIPGGAAARPFKTYHNALGIDLYLRIAPELYLKRLVVGGLEKVYEINRNFRNEGISSEHNPEFTMLEFYEAYCDYYDLMELTEELLVYLCQNLLGRDEIFYGDELISFKRPFARIKFKEALLQFSGLSPSRFEQPSEVISLAKNFSPEKGAITYGKALDIIFDKCVKPHLLQPTFVLNPPREISPLAKASRDNPEEAERFELIIAGMEIANAFTELNDPVDQRARFEQQAEARKSGDEEAHWLDLDYLNALEYGLPPTGGEGIGIDRLTMLLANRRSIREVILFPLLRPK
ncbi:MAG: lysine--tRNA ligase [Candidatus Aminicenantes bacterium]|nr:lysine--tRNA ligase [Candidatus Aminicenantes bacterium]